MTERARMSALARWHEATPEEKKRITDAATGRQRQARAVRLAEHVDEVLAQAGELTHGQVAALRALLPARPMTRPGKQLSLFDAAELRAHRHASARHGRCDAAGRLPARHFP